MSVLEHTFAFLYLSTHPLNLTWHRSSGDSCKYFPGSQATALNISQAALFGQHGFLMTCPFKDDPSSPIYGMPAIEIWKCKQCVVLKRSMGTGYSGVDNPLFYLSNVKMQLGPSLAILSC